MLGLTGGWWVAMRRRFPYLQGVLLVIAEVERPLSVCCCKSVCTVKIRRVTRRIVSVKSSSSGSIRNTSNAAIRWIFLSTIASWRAAISRSGRCIFCNIAKILLEMKVPEPKRSGILLSPVILYEDECAMSSNDNKRVSRSWSFSNTSNASFIVVSSLAMSFSVSMRVSSGDSIFSYEHKTYEAR